MHVDITTPPIQTRQGSSFPTNYYDVAMLRWGDATGYFDAVPVVGGPQWLAVPSGTTRVGYACKGGAVISVAEVIGGTPPFGGAGALSTLSDVALASPADTQVLTYQASSSKWINAAASGGGGGGDVLLLDYAQSSDVSGSSMSANTWTTWTTQNFTPTNPSASIEVAVSGHLQAQAQCNAGSRLLIDGTTAYKLGGMFSQFPNCLSGAGSANIGPLSVASHSVALQVVADTTTNVVCRPATRNAESLSIRVWQRG